MTISGTIYDANTGQTLPGATIVELQPDGALSGNGTVSDSAGNYSLNVNGNSLIKFSYLGYESVTDNASSSGNEFLFPNSNSLPPVTVTAPHYTPPPPNYLPTNNASMSSVWTTLKPLLPWVAGIFVLGYLINESHEKSKKKYRR